MIEIYINVLVLRIEFKLKTCTNAPNKVVVD